MWRRWILAWVFFMTQLRPSFATRYHKAGAVPLFDALDVTSTSGSRSGSEGALPARPWPGQPWLSGCGKPRLPHIPGTTKPDIVVPVLRLVPVTVRSAEVPGFVVPGAPARL